MTDEPCRCRLCLALLELAASAERNFQAARRNRKMRAAGARQDKPR